MLIWNSGFRGIGISFEGLKIRVWALGSRGVGIWGDGFRAIDFELRDLWFKAWRPGALWFQDSLNPKPLGLRGVTTWDYEQLTSYFADVQAPSCNSRA